MSFLKKFTAEAQKLAAQAEQAFKNNGGEQLVAKGKAELDKAVEAGKKVIEENQPAIEEALTKAEAAAAKVAEGVQKAEGQIDAEIKKVAKKFNPKG